MPSCFKFLKRRTFGLRIGLALAVSSVAVGQESPLPEKNRFHLYLLAGQSNMAGRGTVEDADKRPHARVLVLDQNGQWKPAVEPLHWDKPTAGVGPGLAFGREIVRSNPKVVIGLIPCAVGGSPIDAWQPGVYFPATRSHPWDDAIRRTRLAMEKGSLKGILWHQGESDCKPELAPFYEKKLHELIQRFRSELKAPGVPFIVGQMGKFPDHPWKPESEPVDEAHRTLPKKVANTAYVGAEGLNHRGDHLHFDSASARELGRRYAETMIKLTEWIQSR